MDRPGSLVKQTRRPTREIVRTQTTTRYSGSSEQSRSVLSLMVTTPSGASVRSSDRESAPLPDQADGLPHRAPGSEVVAQFVLRGAEPGGCHEAPDPTQANYPHNPGAICPGHAGFAPARNGSVRMRFAPLLTKRLRAQRRGKVGRSWYVDETYIKVRGGGASCTERSTATVTWSTRCSARRGI